MEEELVFMPFNQSFLFIPVISLGDNYFSFLWGHREFSLAYHGYGHKDSTRSGECSCVFTGGAVVASKAAKMLEGLDPPA